MRPPALLEGEAMTDQEWIDPASCPPHKTYYGRRYAVKDSVELHAEGVPTWQAEDLAVKITQMLVRTWEHHEGMRRSDYLPEVTLKFDLDGDTLTVEGDIRGVKR